MVFSFKGLFRNKEKEVKKADLAKSKPVPKPVREAQTKVRNNFNNILPETVESPSLPEATESNVKLIEFSPDLINEFGLHEHVSRFDEHNKKSDLDNKRKYRRLDSNKILDMKIHVFTTDSYSKGVNEDLLSDIGGGGLQIISDKPKKLGDKLSFVFTIARYKFSFEGEVVNIRDNTDHNKRYGISFIDPLEDNVALIEQLVASIISNRRS